ncbi:MAG: HEAT repeat domain-containing protein [Candidatus Riflebacteria bacterium]|nr:HEAT repeat domain-containing protein [Candidatus Riflebacteria bacterium]
MTKISKNWWESLFSREKSFRIQAIEEGTFQGKTQEDLNRLLKLKEQEKDEECLFLLDCAITAIQGRLPAALPSSPEQQSEDSFIVQFQNADSQTRAKMLLKLDRKQREFLAKLAPDLLVNEQNPAVAATIIRIFCEFWSRDKLNLFLSRLSDSSLILRLAALEALVKLAPDGLLKLLPRLLCSEDPRIRSLAIEALEKLDKDEALNHLENLLLSNNPDHKKAVLPHLFMLPFEDVRKIALKFLVSEKDSDLLVKIGMLFEINPDPEIPLILWEISEMSPKPKSEIVKQILAGAMNVIKEAELLTESFDSYKSRLQETVKKRMATRFVKQCVSKMSGDESAIDRELRDVIESKIAHPLIRSAFEESLSWPVSEKIKGLVKNLLGEKTPGGDDSLALIEKKESSKPEASEKDKKIRQIANFTESDFEVALPTIKAILADPGSPSDLLAVTLRAAKKIFPAEKRSSFTEFNEKANEWLKSSEPNLASAALEFLFIFAYDYIMPFIGGFLRSPMKRLQGTALEIITELDPSQGVSILMAMLKKAEPEERKSILSFFVYFDFSLIREQLTEFICLNSEKEFFEASLFLFQTNPEIENLYFLFKFENLLPPNLSVLAQKARLSVISFLMEQKLLTSESLKAHEEKFQLRFRKERDARNAIIAEYSLKKLKKPEEGVNFLESDEFQNYLATGSAIVKKIAELARMRKIQVLAGIVLVILLLGSFFVHRKDGKPKPMETSGALPSKEVAITGSVFDLDKRSSMVMILSTDNKKYLFELPPMLISNLSQGDKVGAVLVPYRLGPDGIFISKAQRFNKK